jgi:hypothetical protein
MLNAVIVGALHGFHGFDVGGADQSAIRIRPNEDEDKDEKCDRKLVLPIPIVQLSSLPRFKVGTVVAHLQFFFAIACSSTSEKFNLLLQGSLVARSPVWVVVYFGERADPAHGHDKGAGCWLQARRSKSRLQISVGI